MLQKEILTSIQKKFPMPCDASVYQKGNAMKEQIKSIMITETSRLGEGTAHWRIIKRLNMLYGIGACYEETRDVVQEIAEPSGEEVRA